MTTTWCTHMLTWHTLVVSSWPPDGSIVVEMLMSKSCVSTLVWKCTVRAHYYLAYTVCQRGIAIDRFPLAPSQLWNAVCRRILYSRYLNFYEWHRVLIWGRYKFPPPPGRFTKSRTLNIWNLVKVAFDQLPMQCIGDKTGSRLGVWQAQACVYSIVCSVAVRGTNGLRPTAK